MAPRRHPRPLTRKLFTRFRRENRPLSTYLRSDRCWGAFELARHLSAEQCQQATDELVEELIEQLELVPPALGEWRQESSTDGGHRPGDQRSHYIPLTRVWISIEVAGAAELLECWPDRSSEDLVEVNPWGDVGDDPARNYDAEYNQEAAVEWHRRFTAIDRWSLDLGDGDEPARLHTFIDLSDAEQDDVEADRRDLRAEFIDAIAGVRPIVDAIGEQVRDYCAHELSQDLSRVINERKRSLSRKAAISRQLSWPSDWKAEEPALVSTQALSTEVTDAAGVTPDQVGPLSSPENAVVELRHRVRLSPATFEDVQRTMRAWVNAVERYPGAFSGLSEDRLSDLLAATLNAALPGAHREVYRRRGKTDIFVTADLFAEGLGPSSVFIAECKKWHGGNGIRMGYRQLLRYLNSQDTATFIVVFNDKLAAAEAQKKALEALMAEDGFLTVEHDGPAGWPILTFTTKFGQRLDVCLAVVNIDDPGSPPRRKARRGGASDVSSTPSN